MEHRGGGPGRDFFPGRFGKVSPLVGLEPEDESGIGAELADSGSEGATNPSAMRALRALSAPGSMKTGFTLPISA